MIEQQTIGGRKATVAYLSADLEPAGKGDAELIKAVFTDGSVMFLTPLSRTKAFDPSEPRDEQGRWTDGGGGGEGGAGEVGGGAVAHAQALTGAHIVASTPTAKPNSRQVFDIAKQLNDRAGEILQNAVGQRSIEGPDPKTDAFLSDVIAADLKAGLHNGHSAADWYSSRMKATIDIATKLHPEMANDPDKRFGFRAALAVTSQGEKVDSSSRLTEVAYDAFNKTGKFPTDIATKDPNIGRNFVKLNKMIDRFGVSGTKEFFDKEMPVRDLEKITGQKITGAGKGDMVYGSAILGPKIGQGFYQNLGGNFKPLTTDMWFMRSWGRITNTGIGQVDMAAPIERLRNALKDEGMRAPTDPEKLHDIAQKIFSQHERDFAKNEGGYRDKKKSELILASERYVYNYGGHMQEQPRGVEQRHWMRDVFNQALDKLAKQGINLDPAGGQATWWTPEKVLYEHLGARVVEADTDYAKSFKKIAEERGLKA
jgi:hypothetical protein